MLINVGQCLRRMLVNQLRMKRIDGMADQIPHLSFPVPQPRSDDLNATQRTPLVLLLDTSASMAGEPIKELNRGLNQLRLDLQADPQARRGVEIAVVTFGGSVTVVNDFFPAAHFATTDLIAAGNTPLGGAVLKGLDLLQARKRQLRESATSYTRPWMFLITDGAPTDEWRAAAAKLQEEEERKGVLFYAVGVADADMALLKKLSPSSTPLMLQGIEFQKLFRWLSDSMSRVSRSRPGQELTLAPATGPTGWGTIST